MAYFNLDKKMMQKNSNKIEFESSNVDFKIFIIVSIILLIIISRSLIVGEILYAFIFGFFLFYHFIKMVNFKKVTFYETEIIITQLFTKKLINRAEWSEIKRIELFYFSDRLSREKDVNLVLKNGVEIRFSIHAILMEDLYNNVLKSKNLEVFVERNNKLEKYFPPSYREFKKN